MTRKVKRLLDLLQQQCYEIPRCHFFEWYQEYFSMRSHVAYLKAQWPYDWHLDIML